MEYNELLNLIDKKRNESERLYGEYNEMCQKFFKDREKLDNELKKLLTAYLIKPETNIVGRCFKTNYGNNDGIKSCYKIIDTTEEDGYCNNSNSITLKVLEVRFDDINGKGINVYNHYPLSYREVLFHENEISPKDFDEILKNAMCNILNTDKFKSDTVEQNKK